MSRPTMKAWQYDGITGGLEKNLKINDAATQPAIGDDEILVEVHAMALNPVDFKVTESGMPLTALGLKCIPGADFCGRVAKTGQKVDSFQIGEWVFGAKVGAISNGTLGQYVSVSQDMLTSLPNGVEVDDAATVGTVGLAEIQAIKPNVKSGDKVFINGGSGGTGVYGIQIAKALGCHVTTTCSTGNVKLCESLGADEVIDYKTSNIVDTLAAKGPVFQLAVDNVGSPAGLYKQSASYLLPNGKFVQVGATPSLGGLAQITSNLLVPSFLGGGKRSYQILVMKASTDGLKQLGAWLREGKVRAVLDEVFEWEDAPRAFEKLKTGRSKGKLVIHVKQDSGKGAL
ncbi:GroES-like protein [Macroventuria anomochaeta]|uniref:GroES-like protein n=1 Tax=Macroventuria anomochaeta TaxID=301207 RepID=A0ACB6RS34_9PLEO|nr:GroES-like protein [Macroventuria anomochaeta]KAF2624512.1 GroES-like protein [Macroventuria anomochaeta]